MDVFDLAAIATIVQVGLWLLLGVFKTLFRIWRMVMAKRKKPGKPDK